MKGEFSLLESILRIIFGKNLERLTAAKIQRLGRLFRGHRGVAVMGLAVVKFILCLERLRVRRYPRKHVLFVGQAYYNAWYLSRALRGFGWKADLLNWDPNESNQIYYHGEDVKFQYEKEDYLDEHLRYFFNALISYDIFHFSNAWAMCFGFPLHTLFSSAFRENAELEIICQLGKKIVYSHNGCLDGVTQTSFSKWGPESVCSICRWQNEPSVCSDERNAAWVY